MKKFFERHNIDSDDLWIIGGTVAYVIVGAGVTYMVYRSLGRFVAKEVVKALL